MTYTDVLAMPLKTFWSFQRQVDRLRAEDDLRMIRLLIASESSEGATKTQQALQRELASPAIVEQTFDRVQFNRLKNKYGRAVKQRNNGNSSP